MLTSELTKFLVSTWARDEIPKHWGESMILPICKIRDRASCENHKITRFWAWYPKCSRALPSTSTLEILCLRIKPIFGLVRTVLTTYLVCQKFLNISTFRFLSWFECGIRLIILRNFAVPSLTCECIAGLDSVEAKHCFTGKELGEIYFLG